MLGLGGLRRALGRRAPPTEIGSGPLTTATATEPPDRDLSGARRLDLGQSH